MHLKTTFSIALALALTLTLGSSAVFAQDMSKSAKPMTAQQQRMVNCNKEATGKTGDTRKTFMSACLKGEQATAGKTTQQEKMKTCNADAKTKALKGPERRTFMSTCLKTDATAAHQ